MALPIPEYHDTTCHGCGDRCRGKIVSSPSGKKVEIKWCPTCDGRPAPKKK